VAPFQWRVIYNRFLSFIGKRFRVARNLDTGVAEGAAPAKPNSAGVAQDYG
jgi:hypothetical protein